ncbi:MAG: hypothetical protein COB38_07555 [Gammaproteobacteria bacterium]|nr:MAG: hypothetical protein COB38_07555 [Gammaproteobacteria bacterium]
MKNVLVLAILFFTLFVGNVKSEEITEQSFIGKWCGTWDQIFEFCLTIDSLDSDSMAKYQWKEFADGKFKKSNKSVSRINRNTLKIDNIFLVIDENNLSQANAIGIFKVRSRVSVVTKQTSKL